MKIDFKKVENKKFLLIVYSTFILLFLITQLDKLSLQSYKLIFIFGVYVLGVIVLYFYYKKKINTIQLFCLTILLFGLIAVFTSPIFVVADEREHFIRSEITSQGVLFPEYVPHGDFNAFKTIASVNEGNANFGNTFLNSSWANSPINYTTTYEYSAFSQNPFYGYLAQAAGILLVKFLDLNNIWMLWFGRICNLMLYVLIVGYAIRKAPKYKIPLGVVACLPLAIYQASSLSIDAIINGLGILTISYFLYLSNLNDKKFDWKNMVIFYILVLLVSFTKVTYLGLIFLIFLVPKSKYKDNKIFYLTGIFFIITIVISFIWSFKYASPKFLESWRLYYVNVHNVNEQLQIGYIIHNLFPFLQTLFNPKFLIEVIKKFFLFGNFPYRMDSNFLIVTYAVFFLVFSLFYPIKIRFNKKVRLMLFLILALIFYGTLIVLYLTFTPVGANTIDGIWSRYFICLLLLIPMIISTGKFKDKEFYTNLTITIMMGFVVCMNLLNFLSFY